MGVEIALRRMLKGFYDSAEIATVPQISEREFGIGDFGKKISSRHLAFKNAKELNTFLREKTPFYISYSSARYELPAARPMEKKGFVGGDLIYEFDADDIKTDCKSSHDSWKCPQCGSSGKGNVRECSSCGAGTKIDEWVCPECITETKKQTLRMLRALENDFNFSDGVQVNFSGSKGFHTHVRSSAVQKLSRAARLELLDYLTGTNLSLEAMGFVFSKGSVSCPRRGIAKGWAKRLLAKAQAAFEAGDADRIGVMGSVLSGAASKLLKEKQRIISGMERGQLLSASGVKPEKFWKSALQYIASEEQLTLDRQTSVDINKIIRVPNTLHGSTGLQAKIADVSSLNGFDALKESVVLPESEMKISNASSPKFYVGGKWFGPFKEENVSLPSYAAFFLLARGAATEMV